MSAGSTQLRSQRDEESVTPADSDARRVVYLLGAGATQGTVSFAGSLANLVMPGLIDRLLKEMHDVYTASFSDHPGVKNLVNDVVDDKTDFEHLLTFLADTPSNRYQDFASRLRKVFASVLRTALSNAAQELGDKHSALYSVLLDMHEVSDSGEVLQGFLTLNYDSFLEHAIESIPECVVDYGVRAGDIGSKERSIPVLKLHGSFSWHQTWPIELGDAGDDALWIPPGIRKAKGDYPFNAIWGAARELLDCDILRIVGCNLGSNDWDLVSLLFTTMHGRESARPYEVEVIGWPGTAARIANEFPYLGVKSLFEVADVGPLLVAEVLGGEPMEFSALDELHRKRAVEGASDKISNPFEHWLRLKGELMLGNLTSIETERNNFKTFVEGPG
jgi:hypothetical protein